MEKINKIKKNGFSLVELIIAVGIFSILAVGVVFVTTNSYSNFQGTGDRQTVSKFAQEAVEATRAIRDNCWQDVEDAAGSATGITKNQDGIWQFGGESDTQGSLIRTVAVANVQRNEAGDIVESGGTDDPDTKKVTVTVSGSGIEDYTLTTFLTNWSNKEWCQKDWTAGVNAEFWQGPNKFYDSSNINSTLSNQLVLNQGVGGGASWGEWLDLVMTASSTSIQGIPYYATFSADGNTMYSIGRQDHDFRAYDISGARSGSMTESWSIDITEFTTGGKFVILHPNGNYAYAANATIGTKGGTDIVIIDLAAHTYTTHAAQLQNNGDPILVMDDAGDYLYSFNSYGRVMVYDISADGSTLTTVNTGQQLTYYAGEFTTYRFYWAWYDDSQDKIYATCNNWSTNKDLMKIGVADKAALTIDYGMVADGSTALKDFYYIDDNASGYPRFLFLSSDTSGELRAYEDTGSGFSLVDYVNPSAGATFLGFVVDDNDKAVIAGSTDAWMGVFDIADLSNISETAVSTNMYNAFGTATPLRQLFYNEALGGYFFFDATAGLPRYFYLTFVEREQVGGGAGVYTTLGYATSSIMDIGASDQQLSQVSIEQNVPSGCTLDIILQGSDTANFASYESQTFTNAASAYTSVTNQNLNNKRFLRYVVHLEPCTTTLTNDTTATLYSFKLKYK